MLDQDSARALLALADAGGAQVALIGDRHQLPAVGRGGVLDLAARYAADRCIEFGGVRRFTDPAYADLSLRMRSGVRPGEVFDELVRRGDVVIHPSDVERQDLLAAKAAHGQLVVADTREQVARINHVAHRVRVVTGQAADSVITSSGEQIGAGDTIATRQNNAEVGVANREMWTVIGSSAAGLHVKGENGQRVLPPAYVHEHVELAYATTAYGAQGSTVTTSHVLIGEHTGAASAYVGMTRGRERNVAHLVAESDRGRPHAVDRGVRARPRRPRSVALRGAGCRSHRPLRSDAGSLRPPHIGAQEARGAGSHLPTTGLIVDARSRPLTSLGCRRAGRAELNPAAVGTLRHD